MMMRNPSGVNRTTPEMVKRFKDLLLDGARNKDIAEELHIRLRTVKGRMSSLFAKYKITDGDKRVKLARLLYREKENNSEILSPNNNGNRTSNS